MRHARLTRFVDRIVAVSMVCLVCSILIVAGAVEAIRLRLSRAHGVALPASRSRVAAVRGVPPRDARMDATDVECAARVEAFAARAVGVAGVGTSASSVEPESGLFI